MAGLRVFSGNACIVLSHGGALVPILPPVPDPIPPVPQSAYERSLGLPQVLGVVVADTTATNYPQVLGVVVSYQDMLKPSMGVPANELYQE